MNDAIRKFAQEVKEKIATLFQGEQFQKFLTETKAADDADSGTFEVVITTAAIDRQGESIDPNGCDAANYLKNPIVLWGHDYYSLPIGICDSLRMEGGKWIAKGRFAPDTANPFAQQVRRLYDLGIVRATSVGIIVEEMNGNVIMKWELLEFSFVPVPANPEALRVSAAQARTLDIAMIAAKGLKLEPQTEVKDQAQTVGAILAELSNIVSDAVVRASQLILGIVQSEFGKSAEGKAQIAEDIKANTQITAIKDKLAELEKILKAGEGEERADGPAPKQRSEDAGADGMKDLNDFLLARQLLKSVITTASEALTKLNEKTSARRSTRK